jgi:hypothetical protein
VVRAVLTALKAPGQSIALGSLPTQPFKGEKM